MIKVYEFLIALYANPKSGSSLLRSLYTIVYIFDKIIKVPYNYINIFSSIIYVPVLISILIPLYVICYIYILNKSMDECYMSFANNLINQTNIDISIIPYFIILAYLYKLLILYNIRITNINIRYDYLLIGLVISFYLTYFAVNKSLYFTDNIIDHPILFIAGIFIIIFIILYIDRKYTTLEVIYNAILNVK